MKKIRLFFVFALGLIFILSLNSCTPSVKKGDIIIEKVESRWLVFEVDNITEESYNNPQNLFLTGPNNYGETQDYCHWYRNVNGKYELVSINFTPSNALLSNLVYKIKDTINVDEDFYFEKNQYNEKNYEGFKILAEAYKNHQGELINRSYSKEYLASYLGLVAKTDVKDSLVEYLPPKKAFVFYTAKPISENRFDPTLTIFILLSLILTCSIVRVKKHYYHPIEKAETARKLLFWILVACNAASGFLWLEWKKEFLNFILVIVVAFFLAFISYLLFSLAIRLYEKLIKKTQWKQKRYIDEVNKFYLSLIISILVFLNIFLVFDAPLKLSLIGASIVFLPALFSFTKLIIWFTSEIKRQQK